MTDDSATVLILVGAVVLLTVGALVAVFSWYAATLASVFSRRGVEPWRAWVPVLNEVEILRLGGRPPWAVVFLFIPVLCVYGVIVRALAAQRIGASFGRGEFVTVLAVLCPPVWSTVLAATRDPGDLPRAQQPASAPTAAASTVVTPDPVSPPAVPGGVVEPPSVPLPPAPVASVAPALVTPVPVVPEASPAPVPPAPVVPAASAASAPPAPAAPALVPPVPAAPAAVPAPAEPAAPTSAVPPPPAPVILPAATVASLPAAGVEVAAAVEAPPPAPVAVPAPVPPAAPALGAPVNEPPAVADDGVGATVFVAREPDFVWELVDDDGLVYPLSESVVVLGRLPMGDERNVQYLPIIDSSRTLSKQHACLTLAAGEWTIADLGSTNGVRVESDGVETAVPPGASAGVTGRLVLGTLGLVLRRAAGASGRTT